MNEEQIGAMKSLRDSASRGECSIEQKGEELSLLVLQDCDEKCRLAAKLQVTYLSTMPMIDDRDNDLTDAD